VRQVRRVRQVGAPVVRDLAYRVIDELGPEDLGSGGWIDTGGRAAVETNAPASSQVAPGEPSDVTNPSDLTNPGVPDDPTEPNAPRHLLHPSTRRTHVPCVPGVPAAPVTMSS